ncbi:MAG: Gfo/Idh/MocA family oxidoreductase [Bacteroidota bacterium]
MKQITHFNNINKVKNKIDRRRFLQQTTTAAIGITIVPSYVLGKNGLIPPSDRITLGFIGCGKQSRGLGMRLMKDTDGVQMIAACDVHTAKAQRFQNRVNTFYAEVKNETDYKGCDIYKDYEQLIERKDIDAVVIATPDHWHAPIAIAAMKAGKDVYCEKPMAHTVEEGRAMVKVARKYDRVFQTGSMQRSWEKFRHAVELVRNGYIGDIKTMKVNVGDPAIPCDLATEEKPTDLNWNKWIGPASVRGYNHFLAPSIEQESKFWSKWRDYAEFGNGILSDWGAHMFDIAQWGLGMDDSGPVEWIPPSDPDATRGLKMIYTNGIEMIHEDFGKGWAVQFNGTKGKIEVSRKFLESDIKGLVERTIGANEKRVYKSDNHAQDWISAIRVRTQPICDVEIGHRTASICNIANIAYQLGRPLTWDPVKEKFKGDREANKMRGKQYRKPFGLG